MNTENKTSWPRKIARFCGWTAASLLTLIVLFYTVEAWRGKRAWNTLEREAVKRGESLSLASMAPSPIPDDENLFSAPVFQPLSDYEPESGLALNLRPSPGLERLRQIDPYFGRGHNDARNLGISLVALGEPQPTDLNAWRHFYEKHSKIDSAGTVEPARYVLTVLNRFAPEIDQIREAASQRSKARFPLRYELGFFAQSTEHWKVLTRVAQVLRVRAVAHLDLHDSAQAFQDLQLAFRLADSVREEPFFFSHHFRQQILKECVQIAWEGLARQAWSAEQLTELQAHLQRIDLLTEYQFQNRGETLAQMEMWNIILTQRNRHLARLKPKAGEERFWWNVLQAVYPCGWAYQNQVRLYRFYSEDVAPIISPSEQRVFVEKMAINGAAWKKLSYDPVFHHVVLPKVREMVEGSSRSVPFLQTIINQAMLGCALERYRLANGSFPSSLQALQPQFVQKLPHDLINGKPLHFKLLPGGSFRLYSVGFNGTDDDGVPSPTDSNKEQNLGEGDWVWKYPAQK